MFTDGANLFWDTIRNVIIKAGVLFEPGERRISPAQDKKNSLIRRPRFFIRRPKGIFT